MGRFFTAKAIISSNLTKKSSYVIINVHHNRAFLSECTCGNDQRQFLLLVAQPSEQLLKVLLEFCLVA